MPTASNRRVDWPDLFLLSPRPSISTPASAQLVPSRGLGRFSLLTSGTGRGSEAVIVLTPFAVAFEVRTYGGLTGPPSAQLGSLTPAGGLGGVHVTPTDPANPLTEVRVNGMDPSPLEGMVILLAEIVKLGVAAGACALAAPKPSVRSDIRTVRAVFLLIIGPPGRSSQQPPG
jgi:hypothetical protein